MNFLPLNSFSLHALSICKETLMFSLNAVQKKVSGIALFAFGCLAMSYLVYFFCCKIKKEVQVKKKEEYLPVHPLEKPLSPSAIDRQEKKVENNIPLEQQNEGLKKQDIKDADYPLLKQTLMELPFEEQRIQEALDIFNRVKGDKKELKNLFTDYFKRALLLPEEKISRDFYTFMVSGQPEIVEMIADTAAEICKTFKPYSKEQEQILNNLSKLFEFLENTALSSKTQNNEEAYLVFLRKVIESIHSGDEGWGSLLSSNPFDIFIFCNLELLSTLLQKNVDWPWDLFQTLILKSSVYFRQENSLKVILAIALPTLQNAQQLEKLYEEAKQLPRVHNEPGLSELICEQLSLEQMQMLVKAWHKQLDKEQFGKQVSEFLFFLKTDPRQEWLRIIENLLCANPDIDLERIIEMNRDSDKASQSYLCALYMMRQLNIPGNDMRIKMEKAQNGLRSIKVSDRDALRLFSSLLADQSSPERLYEIISLINMRDIWAIEEMMIAILKTQDLAKIQQAFTPFWIRFIAFLRHARIQAFPNHSFGSRVFAHVETKEQLRTVYQAIPQTLSERRQKMDNFFLKGRS